MKRFTALFAAFIMALSAMPPACFHELSLIAAAQSVISGSYISATAATFDEASEYMKQAVVNRVTDIEISLTGAALASLDPGAAEGVLMAQATAVLNNALRHTAGGDSRLGDYGQKSINRYEIHLSGSTSGNMFTSAKFTYKITYYSSAEDEAYLSSALENLYRGELNLAGLGTKEKLFKIYGWIVNNVSYDYDILGDYNEWVRDPNAPITFDTASFTAYGALYNRRAVCQGISALFYRICMDNGIDCRIIGGVSNNSSHAWNIVSVDGVYYYADATWDAMVPAGTAGRQEKPGLYFRFLRGYLSDHIEEPDEITGSLITSSYNMAAADSYISAFKTADGGFVHLDGTPISTEWYRVEKTTATCTETVTLHPNISVEDDADRQLRDSVLSSYSTEKHSYSGGVCEGCGRFEDGFGAALSGFTVTWSEKITLNFYIRLSDALAGSSSAYVLFTLPDKTTRSVSVASAGRATLDGVTHYVFPCEVLAGEIGSAVTAQVIDGGRGGFSYSYSVKDYADRILSSGSYSAEDMRRVQAMLDYCAER